MAVLQAARALPIELRATISKAVQLARDGVRGRDWQDPNQVAALESAQQELDRRP